MTAEEWQLDEFEIGKFIGEGKFGKVYLAREKHSGYVIALKVTFKKKLEKYQFFGHLRREIEIQHSLDHPNFHDETRVFLVFEYAAQGELYKLLKNLLRFSEKRAATYVASLAKALAYCHKNHVIHRDIKPENLLLDYEEEKKGFGREVSILEADGSGTYGRWVEEKEGVVAFGLESGRREEGSLAGGYGGDMAGGQGRRRKGVVMNKAHDQTVDNWTLGILCYEFLYSVPPFEAEDKYDTFRRILKVDVVFPSSPFVSPEAKDLISKEVKISSSFLLDTTKE
ncbi:hypothetical protein KFK09_008571 [Dendrobium nobile]|uniref:Protein kinase domain-containing protein n=1 Tax=Dendrobium nobile TaxID=94219 RepID=A0A8T3BR82_DENNO|nr:hypothetical protein KFK09_008571 [Dendrobium nobile]